MTDASEAKLLSLEEMVKILMDQRDKAFSVAMDFWIHGRPRTPKSSSKFHKTEELLSEIESEIFDEETERQFRNAISKIKKRGCEAAGCKDSKQ